MPLLDQDLPARAQQGDENALAALIARMMPAIRKGAAECTAPGLDFDDAVQEGLIGLFHAVRGFDPAAGQTFTAYAAACIRHAQQVKDWNGQKGWIGASYRDGESAVSYEALNDDRALTYVSFNATKCEGELVVDRQRFIKIEEVVKIAVDVAELLTSPRVVFRAVAGNILRRAPRTSV